MPLINGMKMACEPCIRGHRSTKCTHANERLMVPVRKPGRPLSQCPHPKDQQCGCGSVTAAIPRKQTCHCGSSTPPTTGQTTPQELNGAVQDASSPTKSSFKVQKTTSRPQSSRKQSFDPMNLERMDVNNINIVSFDQRLHAIPPAFANGYILADGPQLYGHVPQYMNFQAQFSHMPIQPPPHIHPTVAGTTSGFVRENGNGLENVMESPLGSPTESSTNGSNVVKNGGSCCAPSSPAVLPKDKSNGVTNGSACCAPPVPTNVPKVRANEAKSSGSCCAPKRLSHSHSSSSASSISEPPEPMSGSCCSSEPAPLAMKHEANMTPRLSHQITLPNGMPFNPALYPQYLPQTTVFTYPSTYGSFQNPLQPSAWRQSVLANSYGNPHMQAPIPPNSLPYDTPVVPESVDTVHTCGCGDGCQCIGCAAHPYNDATQDYVRSAWSSMNMEQVPAEIYTNGHASGNGHATPRGETISSPTAQTPSSTASANGEEQSLSASDFFFVNYPFTSEDSCGGESQSCPCGDDCQCLGCTIHQQPPIPCEGQEDVCPCGDDCECIGCEIHNGTMKL